MMDADLAVGPLAHHGEGPVWDDVADCLYWVDMLAGDVLRWDGTASPSRHHVGRVAAALRPRRGGGLIVAVERGFALIECDWSQRTLAEAFTDPAIRMNDGACDPQGRFYCGSMAYDATPGAASLYRLDPDLSCHIVLAELTVSNGLCWNLSGDTAYYVDSATQRVDAFDFDPDSGSLHNRRPVVAIDAASGSPDGMTIDADGNLWVALWDGAAVHSYSPGGNLLEVVRVPTPRPSACAFGGSDLDTLYITTSALDLYPEQSEAGSVFAVMPGVRGVPTPRFAG